MNIFAAFRVTIEQRKAAVGNLVPGVFHLPTPKGAREERPWFRPVTSLSENLS